MYGLFGGRQVVDDPFDLGSTSDQYTPTQPSVNYIQHVNDSFMPSGKSYERRAGDGDDDRSAVGDVATPNGSVV